MLVIPEYALNYSAKSSAWSAVDRQTVKQTEGLYYNPRPPKAPRVNNKQYMVLSVNDHYNNESTTGADASVEALKLYHMKLTV